MPKNLPPTIDNKKPLTIDSGEINISEKLQKQQDLSKLSEEDSKKLEKKSGAFDISLKEIIVSVVVLILLATIIIGISILPSIIKGQKLMTRDQLFLANYDMTPSENNFVYNGFSFIKLPDNRTSREFWYTQIKVNNKVFDIPMHYSPIEVENITVDVENRPSNTSYEQIFITIDPEEENVSKQYAALSISEFSEKITKIKNIPLKAACTINYTNACVDRPIVDCNSKEYKNSSLIFKFDDRTNKTKIIIDENCVTIQGSGEDLIKATDKLLYLLIGIMK